MIATRIKDSRIPTTNHRIEVYVDGSGCYAEQTKDVVGGTMSRKSVTYKDIDTYSHADRNGLVKWRRWT
jgi:hypothetical protein